MQYKLILLFTLISPITLLAESTNAPSNSPTSFLSESNPGYEKKQLQNFPKKNIEEIFSTDAKQAKHALIVSWENVEGADFYEIEITRTHSCHRRYFKALKNSLDVVVYPNAKYLWRVMAFSKEKVLTDYSPKYRLYLNAPVGPHIVSKFETPYDSSESDRGVASVEDEANCKYPTAENLSQNTPIETNEIPKKVEVSEAIIPATELPVVDQKPITADRQPAYTSSNRYSLWGKSWAKAGMGFNGYFYKQTLMDDNEIIHDAVTSPSFFGEVGTFFNKQHGLIMSANFSHGNINDVDDVIDEDFSAFKLIVDGLYTFDPGWQSTKDSQWFIRYGIGYSSTPILEATTSSNSFELLAAKIISARVGVGYKSKITKHLRPEVNLTAAYPVMFAAGSGDIDLDLGFLVDFSASFNYQIYKNYQIGLMWKSELTNLDYTQKDDFDEVEGNLFIINNHLGLYLGLEF